jgi:hypothetical protein
MDFSRLADFSLCDNLMSAELLVAYFHTASIDKFVYEQESSKKLEEWRLISEDSFRPRSACLFVHMGTLFVAIFRLLLCFFVCNL